MNGVVASLALLALGTCRADPRVATMENMADRACACDSADCAAEFAPRIVDIRGMEQEDYANFPAALLARYDAARLRGGACIAAHGPNQPRP